MPAFKLGICEWGFPMPGPYAVKTAAEMGFSGLELDFGLYERAYPLSVPQVQRAYLDLAEEYGITFPSMTIDHLNRYGMTRPLSSRNGMIALDGIRRGLDAAAEMNIPVIQLPSFNDGAIRNEGDFQNTCEMIKMVCEIAKPMGIQVASENVLSAKDTRRMVETVGYENFAIMFDTQNYFLEDRRDTAAFLREIYPYVVQVHLKDGFNGKLSGSVLGTGESGFFKTADVIKETGCTEWLLLENYYDMQPISLLDDNPFNIVKKDIAVVRTIFEII
ncbi:MAG: sugar phosphate isomerase/epimerase family protein [Eubacteriales bacterium]|nr:sugar phosphate isomerase/epimerase family protein [Eubacteriales bacterium]